MGIVKAAQFVIAIVASISLAAQNWDEVALSFHGSFAFLSFSLTLAAVTSLISLSIFGNGLHEKGCMPRIPWNVLELFYPIFMVVLITCASIVGLITAATTPSEYTGYKKHCFASSVLGLVDCIPWAIQAFFQYSINREQSLG